LAHRRDAAPKRRALLKRLAESACSATLLRSGFKIDDGTEDGGALSTLGTTQPAEYKFAGEPLTAVEGTARWYAIQTRSRHEKRVAEDLREKAVKTFLPLRRAERQWSDRRKMVEIPLFAGYVFVQIEPEAQARVPVLQTNGVVGFLGVRGVGSAIPETEIAAIQTVLREKIDLEPHPYVQVGQRVRICGGSLDGLEGLWTGKEGKASLVVSIGLIERSVAMRISGYKVVPVESATT
jgi:transcription termination/antitermination protein NusG